MTKFFIFVVTYITYITRVLKFMENQNYFKYPQMSESDKHSIKLEDEAKPQNIEDDGDQNDEEQEISANNPQGGSQQQITKKRTHRKLDISNFIMKTYKILEDKRNSSIVEWTDEGNCFIVKDKQKFSKEILPKYFKHSKFSSFVRQLNMYDFHKIRKQKQIPIFKHKFFKEGCLDLLHKIKRKSGEDGKQQEMMSKQMINYSEPAIDLNGSSRQLIALKSKTSNQFSIQNEIDQIKKENQELQQSISDINQQINFLEYFSRYCRLNREKKKEKLVKIITSMMFFDLNVEKENDSGCTLRQLEEHFVKDQDPLTFSEYRLKLTDIYNSLKSRLL